MIPPQFATALNSLRKPAVRTDIHLTEIPGPSRLAPFTIALEGELLAAPGDEPGFEPGDADTAAQGRFVVLFNPEGEPSWQGEFRVVTMVTADLDTEIADDPMLDDVVWSWLTDLLANANLSVSALGGTVTRVLSKSYGLGDEPTAELEIRASWTPTDPELAAHLQVWAELMATAAGVTAPPEVLALTEPVPEGVTPIRSHRHPRNHR